MRFCPDCGTPVDLRQPPGDERERHVCPGCNTIHYHNPKVIVGSVVTHEGRILLCRRAIEPRLGFWTIPAGFLELGESAEEGARREAMEEAGARIEIHDLIAVFSIARIDQVQLLYRARLVDPAISAGIESLEVKLVEPARIPWDDLAFPTVRMVLERALELGDAPGPVVPIGMPGSAGLPGAGRKERD